MKEPTIGYIPIPIKEHMANINHTRYVTGVDDSGAKSDLLETVMTSTSWNEAAFVERALRPDTGTEIVFVKNVLSSGTRIGIGIGTSKICWLDLGLFGMTKFCAIDLQISQILRMIKTWQVSYKIFFNQCNIRKSQKHCK